MNAHRETNCDEHHQLLDLVGHLARVLAWALWAVGIRRGGQV
jgi:hypothetical protein